MLQTRGAADNGPAGASAGGSTHVGAEPPTIPRFHSYDAYMKEIVSSTSAYRFVTQVTGKWDGQVIVIIPWEFLRACHPHQAFENCTLCVVG